MLISLYDPHFGRTEGPPRGLFLKGKTANFFSGRAALARGYRLLGEMGFDTSLVFAHALSSSADVREISLSQAEFDGVSGFAHELSTAGSFTPASFAPRAERNASYFFLRAFRRFWQALRVLLDFFRPSQTWRELPRKVAAPVVVWKFFSADETNTVRQAAKAAGISLHSHLLFHLNDVVKPRLTRREHSAIWLLPVPFHQNAVRPVGVQSATVAMAIRSTDTPADVHAGLRKMHERETYWGAILIALATWVLPQTLYRALLGHTLTVKHRIGTFMYLGLWTGNELVPDEAWAAVPPVSSGRPLGVGAVEFNGKLGLGIKLHPNVGLDDTDGGYLLDRWAEAALAWRWN